MKQGKGGNRMDITFNTDISSLDATFDKVEGGTLIRVENGTVLYLLDKEVNELVELYK